MVALAVTGCTTTAAQEADLAFGGSGDDVVVGSETRNELHFTVDVNPPRILDDLRLVLDGVGDVTEDATGGDGSLRYEPPTDLPDGEHALSVVESRDIAGDDAAGAVVPDDATVHHTWRFEIDTEPPPLEISEPGEAQTLVEDGQLAGTTEPGARVLVDGSDVPVDGDGAFATEVDADTGETTEVTVLAVDPAGNTTRETVEVTVVPPRVEVDEVRGVHVTPHAWATPTFRDRILGMAEAGQINTVQLDLKDEDGKVGYDSDVPLAQRSGAATGVYDLTEAVTELHSRGLHIVGRVVAFRDGVLADYAWSNGERDWVIQTPGGNRYAGYGGFTSFAHPEVQEYNLDIAEEAAAAGVDAILWDYIRRPDGPAENLVVPGLSDDAGGQTMEEAIVDFTAKAAERLAPYPVDHGVSVYGIAATRPTEIAQDIPGMAEHVDYVSPMLYPSHWGPGEYDVAEPNRQPYDIIYRSMEGFLEQVEGTGARIVPWLEDTNYRAWDRAEQVREQIRATADHGIDEWLMWDPNVRYTLDAYPSRDE
ncbi:putative glycoside hydrolase [Haloechinothrix sp. LS1_15]|uniref:putative glycoside hydrolase n=1 Tax=Haloechinothrix sp. LS1_15 TaxID=2652248 RepID=UPI00294AB31D|nr:putative glycoside hydrolase [Haloechinothrix sp. LS1_15]